MVKFIKWASLVAIVIVLAMSAAAYWAYTKTQEVPEFYTAIKTAALPKEQRQAEAKKFTDSAKSLEEQVKSSSNWSINFTQDQVNSWLIEELPKQRPDFLPPQVSEPLVEFQSKHILMGVRVETPEFSGVISLAVVPTVTEANEMSITVKSVKAGNLPLPFESFLDPVLNKLRSKEIPVTLDKQEDQVVARFPTRLFAEQKSAISSVVLGEGEIVLSGDSGNEATTTSDDDASAGQSKEAVPTENRQSQTPADQEA